MWCAFLRIHTGIGGVRNQRPFRWRAHVDYRLAVSLVVNRGLRQTIVDRLLRLLIIVVLGGLCTGRRLPTLLIR